MTRSLFIAGMLLASLPWTTAQAQMRPNTQRGATLGGIAGAIAGGIIGDNNDEAGAGAVIGGALGAMAGGSLGNARDRQLDEWAARRQYEVQMRQHAAQQQFQRTQQSVSLADVTAMSKSGLSESLIINQIQQRGVQRRLEVPDIIQLHQSGVSESVISAMQHASVGQPAATPAAAPQPSSIYVERHMEVVPTYVVPRPYPFYRHHYRRPVRRGAHWGLSFGF
jgi:hypothetical protein